MVAFNFLIAFVLLSAPLGFGSGLTKSRHQALPAVVVGVMVAVYLVALASTAIWAAQCWQCAAGSGDEPLFDRSFVAAVMAIGGGVAVAITFATARLGIRLSARRGAG